MSKKQANNVVWAVEEYDTENDSRGWYFYLTEQTRDSAREQKRHCESAYGSLGYKYRVRKYIRVEK